MKYNLHHFLSCIMFFPSVCCSCTEGEVHCLVSQAISFVEERLAAEEAKESRPLRGPYLARLELIRRLRQRGCPEEQQLGMEEVLCRLDGGFSPSLLQ